ncbi:hypothetical protein Chls_058 [Chlamydia suis]|uniref:Uncharacterized protein n=1 Tax=Chlamydia suis TaxID=83559 RepID=A0ABX6IPF7_9CHLA|nr:hypothetical protein Chls_058 [Chlamydia suis]
MIRKTSVSGRSLQAPPNLAIKQISIFVYLFMFLYVCFFAEKTALK